MLFGSAARGQMGLHSDLDLLVVVGNGRDCRALAKSLYRLLRDLPYAKDLLVVTGGDLERQADNPYLIFHTALSEGKELYRASA